MPIYIIKPVKTQMSAKPQMTEQMPSQMPGQITEKPKQSTNPIIPEPPIIPVVEARAPQREQAKRRLVRQPALASA